MYRELDWQESLHKIKSRKNSITKTILQAKLLWVMTLNQESGKYLGSHGRLDLVKSSAVQVTYTRTSNNTGAFASFVNEYEREQEISQVHFQYFFFFLMFFKASYTFSWKASCYFEYCCNTFDLQESPYMTSDPAHTYIHSSIQMTSPTY